MSKKNARWMIVIAVALVACVLVATCVVSGLAAWRYLSVVWESRVEIGPERASTLMPPEAGVLKLWGSEPVTLDPALVTDAYSAEYVVEIFSGLVTLDEELNVVPDIAERWEISPDGRVYAFYLRPEACFHDGKPVTAWDFKYSLERACDPDLGSVVASSYLGDIVGAQAMIRGETGELEGVRVLDDHTLEIGIDAPKTYFLAKLTYSTAFVVDRDNVEAGGVQWARQPNGTGPFRLTRIDSSKIVLDRNERFYAGPPFLESVEFVLSGGNPMSMYEDGQLDVVEVGVSDIERVLDPSNPLHLELSVAPQLNVQYLGLNTSLAPFDDTKVRQAFAHAVEREKLAGLVLKDTVVPAAGILPPGLPGHSEDLQGVGVTFDPKRARELLAESGYGSAEALPPITLHIGGESGILPRAIEAILAMYEENLGVSLSVEEVAWPTFLKDVLAGRCQMFSLGWMGDYPDPQDFLDVLFHSQSENNHTGYENALVDELLERARTESDSRTRMALYRQAEEIIVAEAPWVPLWHGKEYLLVKPRVRGVARSGAIIPWLRSVHIQN